MTEDENIIYIFMNTKEIGKNKCIYLFLIKTMIKSKIILIRYIIRNNTKAPLGIP